jgi:hypothetical protein
MRHRRKRKKFLVWAPVVLAGLLIIAAFIIAPSLQNTAPPSRAVAPNPIFSEPSSVGAPSGGQPQLPGTSGAADPRLDGRATPERAVDAQDADGRGAPPEAAALGPSGPPSKKEPGTRRVKQRRESRPAHTPAPQDDANASDLSVRWNQ